MSPAYQPGSRLRRDLRRLKAPVLAAGVLLLAASVAGGFFSANDFFRGYLIGYLFFLDLALGSLGLLMLQYLTGGAWGIISRRTLEAVTRTLPLLAGLFIPIGFGIGSLYDWAQPNLVGRDHLLQHRAGYLNPAFFFARAGIYWVVWLVLAYFLNRWSVEQDRDPGQPRRPLARLSAGGLTLYLFSITFAAIDWAESLQTHWASTIWGLMFVAAQGLTALAFLILVLALLARREPLAGVLKADHFHDLGKMLLGALMVWAYFAFVQYLIVWSENLVGEIHYYLPRTGTSWGWLGVALIVMLFLVPMLLLLSRGLKRRPLWLASVAVLILAMRYLDVIWIVLPAYYQHGFRVQWMQVAAPFGIAGVWLWVFLRELPRYPLLPVNAPALEVALAHAVD